MAPTPVELRCERGIDNKDWPQCSGYSAQLRMLKGNQCGGCMKKDQEKAAGAMPPHPTLGTYQSGTDATRTVQEFQADARRNAMLARTLPKGTSKSSTGSASLLAAVAKGAPRQITIYIVPLTSTGSRTEASRILANATQAFPEDIPMTGNHPKKMLQGPPNLRLPPPAIYLEGLIAVKDFENETGTPAPYFVLTEWENQKRKSSQSTRNTPSAEGSLKWSRSQTSVPLLLHSEFGDVPGFSKVDFVFASISVAQDGTVSFEWPNLKNYDSLVFSTCLLQDAPFDQGKTKVVHKVIYDGLPWVAKRFFNIGIAEGDVDLQQNRDHLVKEATRLSRTGYFLEWFIAEAKRQDADIEQGIKVTNFKLGVEVIRDGSGPSIASGFSPEQYQAASDAQSNPNVDPVWKCELPCTSLSRTGPIQPIG
ncbi:hypothetical protein B0H14DRAFT_2630596 [Mycena olivaceomarginata]|nr:hypothetical protein B0H14DRAFT_2630596 [Mycena olivaceomarginata]